MPSVHRGRGNCMMRRIFDSLSENDRRRYAAVEVTKLGHGGIEHRLRRLGVRFQDDSSRIGGHLKTCRRPRGLKPGQKKRGWNQTADRDLPPRL